MIRVSVYICLILCAIVILQAGGGPTANPRYTVLPIPAVGQINNKWCWAATLSMAINYYKREKGEIGVVSQCDMATQRLITGQTTTLPFSNKGTPVQDCCGRQNGLCPWCNTCKTDKCVSTLPFRKENNWSASIKIINDILRPYGLTTRELPMNRNLFENASATLLNRQPIILITERSASSHVVLVKGYSQLGDETYLVVNNPLNLENATDCIGCVHGLRITPTGKNFWLESQNTVGRTMGTYKPQVYLAVIKL